MWQGQYDAALVRVVCLEIPHEAGSLDRRPAECKLDAFVSGRSAIQVEENETCTVAPSDVVDDLVEGLLAVNRRVDTQSVVQEA